jgi:hypothetical protein
MDKNQVSQGAPAGIRSTGNRQLLQARLLLLTLLLAFSLASLSQGPFVQVAEQTLRADKVSKTGLQPGPSALDCTHCEREYVECLASGGQAFCDIQYEICLESCFGRGTGSLRD